MSFSWQFLSLLRAQLSAMPGALADEAVPIIQSTADQAAETIRQQYPVSEGVLRRSVRVRGLRRKGASVSIAVVSTAQHAHLFEYGTVRRSNLKGSNRGTMPAKPVVSAVAPRARRTMESALIAMLERKAKEAVS